MDRLKLGFCLGLVLCLFGGSCWANEIDDQIRSQQDQLNKLNQKTKFHQQEISTNTKKKKNYMAELNELDHKIKETEERTRKLDGQINVTVKDINQFTKAIEARKSKVEVLRDLLRQRLSVIYKYGDVAEYNLLMSSSDRVELATATYLLQKIAEQNKKMMRDLATEYLSMANDRKALQQKTAKLSEQRRALQQAKAENQKAVAARKDLVAQIDQSLEAHKQALKEIEDAQQALQATIDRLLAERAKSKQNQIASGKPVKEVVHSGRLQWPLSSHKISSPFGVRIHPKFKTKSQHDGIDIPSPKGTPVKVAGSGTVLFVGQMRGYGNLIIVDHGKGISTVYAHLSAFTTKEGAQVKTGQVIGKVGNTGVATGYHLHFEVRENGKAKNPVNYLPR